VTLAETRGWRIVLVLAGGNALGAYQAGVYQALHEAGIEPDRIVGTSAGAINGAIIASNTPEQRLPRLADLWRPATSPEGGVLDPWAFVPDTWRRTTEAIGTLIGGRPGMFAPLGSSLLGGSSDIPAIYDTGPLGATIKMLVDFDGLNNGAMPFATTAVDLESGEDAVFDTRSCTIDADHLRASAAMPPSFPAVEIDGRLYVDGGLSANLPLDAALSAPPDAPTLCIAVDLLPMAGARPRTLGEVTARTQDLIFSSQARRAIIRWQDHYAHSTAHRAHPVTLVRLAYADQQREVAGKAMDFSPASVRHRWDAGYRDAVDLAGRLASGAITVQGEGLTVVEANEAQTST
jgi:NTE family protein